LGRSYFNRYGGNSSLVDKTRVRNQAIKTALEESLRQVLDEHYGPITKNTVALWAKLSPQTQKN